MEKFMETDIKHTEINREPGDLLVIKFGGKALGDSSRIQKLAHKTAELFEIRPILVVVSAMGDETNRLIRLADGVSGGDCHPKDLIEIVAHGEILSTSVFTTALRALGYNAEAINPASKYWPIIARSKGQIKLAREKINQNVDIEILEDISRSKAMEGIGSLLKNGVIPVVCGFLALSEDGELLTLGRGGSDTSAFLLAKLLGASEVIIVTDVKGLLKADPSKVKSTEQVHYISVDEIDSVMKSGGQVLHPQSLTYKTDKMKARIVHFEEESYEDTGTEIVGFYKARLKGIQKKLAMVTLVGENLSENHSLWKEIGGLISGISATLFGLSFTESFICFYIDESGSDELYTMLNEFAKAKPSLKNVIQRKGVARLNLTSHDNAESPEVLAGIFEILSERGISVIEVITNHSDVSVFVDWADRKEASRIFKRLATDMNLKEVLGG